MWSQTGKFARQMLADDRVTLTIKITTDLTNDFLNNFARLATVLQIKVGGGVKYQDLVCCAEENRFGSAKRMFLEAIHRIEFSNLTQTKQ